jgi:Fe-S-cluster containining protein
MLQEYAQYLATVIDPQLEVFFEKERPYIFCKKGCSRCCESGQYLYTKLEFDLLMYGFSHLDDAVRGEIFKKIETIKKEGEKLYACPFLIEKECAVYPYRGLICRVFGLAWHNEDGSINVPNCIDVGLNYSNVFDKEKNFSPEMFALTGLQDEPVAYNVRPEALRETEAVRYLNLEFGECKPLIEWL